MTTAHRPARRTETGLGATNSPSVGPSAADVIPGPQFAETPLPRRRLGSVTVRPMFELIDDTEAHMWELEAARWPTPFGWDDLGRTVSWSFA